MLGQNKAIIATAIIATIASLATVATSMQNYAMAFNDNNVAVVNGHNHFSCDNNNNCKSSASGVDNSQKFHVNTNCNSQRTGDECKQHIVDNR